MSKLPLYEKLDPQKNNYPLKLLINNSIYGLHAHWHEHIELHFYLSGGCKLMCDNKIIDIEENDLVFINRGQIHFGEMGVEGQYYCIIINPEFFKDLEIKNVEIENLIRNDMKAKAYMEEIFQEFFDKKDGWDMAIKGKVYNLMTYLFRNYKKVDENEEKTTKDDKKRMREIINFISTHYDEKLTSASLAERFFVSEYYFCRYFKKNMGQTPVEYINRYRVEKAVALLQDKEKPIRDIAIAVGFDDQNYFSRVFKKFAGKSPVEYREDI